ncbi:PstS family phosphate ABC transporter substrate-binding protein [Edaphobacter bradus]|uniref:PstS family phosphate ABC transporter substrate-binding protein n=1 Tax=Edaphobacter bradus TaxID=2259016 RepID=UPI0021E04FC1|nr:substrate-binding domain-containing protein [Edaphobacter bradus]
MMIFNLRLTGILSLALVPLFLVPAHAQTSADQQRLDKESSDEQAARAKSVTSKGRLRAYTRKWDLSDLPPYVPQVKVSGTIREWGSNYLADSPLAGYWETAFQKFQPDIKFDDHLKTSEHAISALCFGVSDLGPMGRQIMWDERTAFQREFDYQPTGIVVMTGSFDVSGWNPAIGIFVNKANPLAHLSLKQLDGIFLAPRSGAWRGLTFDESLARGPDGNITTWGQLGLTGEWADKPIHVLGYNLLFHFPEEITTRSMGGVTDKWNENLVEYANKVMPDGTLKLAGDLMLQDLAKDPYAIAYVAGGSKWAGPQVKTVALGARDGGPYFDLTIENVQSRTYPMYADVFFYLNRDPKKPVDPKLKEYLRFLLSREGQQQVVKDGKYLPLTGEVAREQLKKLE